MSNKGKTFDQTIQTLDGLKGRCVIDDMTGCWIFRSGESAKLPRVYIVHPVTGQKIVTTCTKAAWLLAGHGEPPKGKIVYRAVCLCERCVNPEHMEAATQKQVGAALRKSGKHRGRPERSAINAKNSAKRRKLTDEQVSIVRSSDRPGTHLAREFGVSHNCISQVRRGLTHRGSVIKGASVFSWRPA